MKSREKSFIIIILLGMILFIEAILFRFYFIYSYRTLLEKLNVNEHWEYFAIGMIFLKGFSWLGFDLIFLGIFFIFLNKINPNFLKDFSANSSKKYRNRFILFTISIFWFIIFWTIINPIFWINIIILIGFGLIIIFIECKKVNKLPRFITKLDISFNNIPLKLRKAKIIILIIFIIFSAYLFIPSHIQPSNLRNESKYFYIQNGRIYKKSDGKELRLMGWDYHWIHFNGPGEAWDDSAKMERFNFSIIKQDLIWAIESSNFIRICANWFEIESEKGKYNYTILDYAFDVIENYTEGKDFYVLLEIGPIKTSKVWVQASLPEWFPYRIDLQDPNFLEMVKPFIKNTIERYKNRKNLFAYQLENEPDLMTHTITDPDEDYIITGNIYFYLSWLNDYVKSLDPNHFTAVNYFANNLNTQTKLAPVDIILYDYYGTIENTPSLEVFSRKHSQYIRGDIGFGVAELQLNDWHREITEKDLEEEYNACLKSGMTIILWSELHVPYPWDASAISYQNERTFKYYKVKDLYEEFQKEKNIDVIIIQNYYDWLNIFIFISGLLGMIILYYILLKPFKENIEQQRSLLKCLSLILIFIILIPLLLIQTYISNFMFLGFGISSLNLIFAPIIIQNSYLKENRDIKYLKLKIFFRVFIAGIPVFIISIIGFY
ncbi:MAG: hypothetical protein ACTSQP_10885 [Promethearchaeota archaeon]